MNRTAAAVALEPPRTWASRLSERASELADLALRMAGSLVRRFEDAGAVPVCAAMLSRVETASPDQTLEEVAQLFVTGRCAQLPIIVDGKPVGVVTRDDVAAALLQLGPRAPIGAAPCRPVFSVAPGEHLDAVLERLRANPEAVALVVDHGTPVGLVTRAGLLAYRAAARHVA